MNLRDYWLIVRRRRLIIIVSTALVMLFSFWFAKQKVPYFKASTAVKFEQSTQMSGLLVEVLSYSSADSIETQVTLIKSYPILEDVAKRLGRLPQTAAGEAMRESKGYWAALDSISEKLRSRGSRTPRSSRSPPPPRIRARSGTWRTPWPRRTATTASRYGTCA